MVCALVVITPVANIVYKTKRKMMMLEQMNKSQLITLKVILFISFAISSSAYGGSFDRSYGYDLHGSDYDDYKRVTLDQCQYYCNRDDRCIAY
jgi:hypothetical protein